MAENWFLKIDGIDGESTDSAHKGEIDVLSWSWGMTQSIMVEGGGGGARAGRPTFGEFQFVARISKASPKLFLSAATGTRHSWAALTGVKVAGKGQGAEFLKYKLSDVLVTSFHQSAGEASEPTEQFSLDYGKFEVSFSPSSASGKLGSSVDAGFDVRSSKKV